MEEEKLPFPIDDLEVKEPLQITFSDPLQIQEKILQTYFQEPVPFEVPLPFEEIPFDETFYVELPVEPLPVECFVQKQASYGLLDNKYLIRY